MSNYPNVPAIVAERFTYKQHLILPVVVSRTTSGSWIYQLDAPGFALPGSELLPNPLLPSETLVPIAGQAKTKSLAWVRFLLAILRLAEQELEDERRQARSDVQARIELELQRRRGEKQEVKEDAPRERDETNEDSRAGNEFHISDRQQQSDPRERDEEYEPQH